MAFNRSKFNHLPYNVQSDLVKWVKVNALEEIDAVIGSALDYYPLAIGYERVDEEIEGVKAKFLSASGGETVNEAVAEGQMSVILYPHFAETVTAVTHLSAIVMPEVDLSENVNCSAKLGADFYAKADATEIVDANTALGAKIYPVVEGFELITESASLENITEKTCVLTVTLRPGQVLIVDANTYNVLLDNQNAIDIHSGDWIDELNRTTTEITLSAASGLSNLSATMMYTERYL